MQIVLILWDLVLHLVFFRLVSKSKEKITKGAPSLFTIHSDKKISIEKYKRERQRGGEAPTKKQMAARFTNRLEDSDIVVTTSSSGLQI
jgi:hypothetical protein